MLTGVVFKPCQLVPHKRHWDFEQMLIASFKQHLLVEVACERLPINGTKYKSGTQMLDLLK